MLTSNSQSRAVTAKRLVLLIAVAATITGCQPGPGKTVPDNIIGIWKTSHPKYADRYIEIKSDALVFGTGGDTFRRHAIAEVEVSRQGDSTLYTISYTNQHEQRYRFAFFYDPANNGTMRLKNQQHITWTREKR